MHPLASPDKTGDALQHISEGHMRQPLQRGVGFDWSIDPGVFQMAKRRRMTPVHVLVAIDAEPGSAEAGQIRDLSPIDLP